MALDAVVEKPTGDESLFGDVIYDDLADVDDAVPGDVGESTCEFLKDNISDVTKRTRNGLKFVANFQCFEIIVIVILFQG